MPPSESADLADMARRLDQADPDERATLAPQVQRLLLDDFDCWDDLTPAVVTQFLAMRDTADPATRSVGTFIAGHVAIYGDEYVDDRAEVAASVFDALGDESPVVRQTAANPRQLGDIVEKTLRDGEYRPIPKERIAATLFELLHDPDPAVRRRIGKVVFSHGADLIGVHSDPPTAVETLIDTLGDPLNAYCTYTRPVASPRHAALVALDGGFKEYDGSLLADHADTVAECLHDERHEVRSWAARLLDTLVSAGVVSVGGIADDVIIAAQRYDSRALGWQFPRLALRVALVRRDAVDPVCEHLQTRFTAANTRTDRWQSNDPDLLSLSRLVRAADRSFDPPTETLAAVIAQDTAATDGIDPLVLLASDHPEFVAEQLRQGYKRLVEGDLDRYSRFSTGLVVDVADRNPAAIKGVPKVLAEDFANRCVRTTITALIDAHPKRAVHVVPDGFASSEWEAPLSPHHSELIEETAAHWERVPESLVETLINTAGFSYTDRWAEERRGAVRALVALHNEGLSVLPEGFGPFVDLYDQGAFDDDGDPHDPLETDAAEAAGLR